MIRELGEATVRTLDSPVSDSLSRFCHSERDWCLLYKAFSWPGFICGDLLPSRMVFSDLEKKAYQLIETKEGYQLKEAALRLFKAQTPQNPEPREDQFDQLVFEILTGKQRGLLEGGRIDLDQEDFLFFGYQRTESGLYWTPCRPYNIISEKRIFKANYDPIRNEATFMPSSLAHPSLLSRNAWN